MSFSRKPLFEKTRFFRDEISAEIMEYFHGVDETNDEFANNERQVWRDEVSTDLVEWLHTHDHTDPSYSDIYKDVYGIRP